MQASLLSGCICACLGECCQGYLNPTSILAAYCTSSTVHRAWCMTFLIPRGERLFLSQVFSVTLLVAPPGDFSPTFFELVLIKISHVLTRLLSKEFSRFWAKNYQSFPTHLSFLACPFLWLDSLCVPLYRAGAVLFWYMWLVFKGDAWVSDLRSEAIHLSSLCEIG